jgi:hypothetical protein
LGRGRKNQSRYKAKRDNIITFTEAKALVDTLGDNLTKSLVVILYYCGFRINEAIGDGDRKWKVLSVEGRALSKQKKLPDNWMDGEYENKLWWWRRRSSSLPGIVKEDIKVQDGNIYIEAAEAWEANRLPRAAAKPTHGGSCSEPVEGDTRRS